MTECSWTDPCFAPVARLLNARVGLRFRAHNRDSVERGILRAMRRAGLTNLVEYRHGLERAADLLDDLIVELTVGETYFFREPQQLDFIRDQALPDLLARRRADHVIRVWSAGCASGEEPYSLAMLLDRLGLGPRSQILATDVSCEALAKAREAVYPDWSLRDQGKLRTQGYLRQRGRLYELDERIRRRVDFQFLNLALDRYPSVVSGTQDLDLILCRNVLIYFDQATIERIAAKLYDCLADGGWLITASGDPPLDEFAPYKTVMTDAVVVYQRLATLVGAGEEANNTSAAATTDGRRQSSLHHQITPDAKAATSEQSPLVDRARLALREGRYQQAVDLTAGLTTDREACEIHVQALANIDVSRAELVCANAALRNSTSAGLQYLHAVLLMENKRDDEATQAARRAVYLDRNLAVAHLLLGSLQRRCGDLAEAHKAYRNALRVCSAQPPDQLPCMSDGATAAQLAQAARAQLENLESLMESPA